MVVIASIELRVVSAFYHFRRAHTITGGSAEVTAPAAIKVAVHKSFVARRRVTTGEHRTPSGFLHLQTAGVGALATVQAYNLAS
jgi:hypothetical protein